MTESTSTTTEPTPAEKREVLRSNGVTVGSRGKLSAQHEAEYNRLTGRTTA